MENADVIAIYYGPHANAPISLMELGLFAKSKKCVVACPNGYWKRGNVQIVCAKYGIEIVDGVDGLAKGVLNMLREKGKLGTSI